MQQKEDSEKQPCDLAMRKITVATIVGKGSDATLTMQHHQLGKDGLYMFVYVYDSVCLKFSIL